MNTIGTNIRHAELVETLGLLSHLIPRAVVEIQTEAIGDDRWDELRGALHDALALVPDLAVIINLGDAGGR
ncbi:MAG TPA: hypothetical protein VM677_25580 [Actinokineospora sp.]|nr:hypothetical protein [Actinokineospora sp.]